MQRKWWKGVAGPRLGSESCVWMEVASGVSYRLRYSHRYVYKLMDMLKTYWKDLLKLSTVIVFQQNVT